MIRDPESSRCHPEESEDILLRIFFQRHACQDFNCMTHPVKADTVHPALAGSKLERDSKTLKRAGVGAEIAPSDLPPFHQFRIKDIVSETTRV